MQPELESEDQLDEMKLKLEAHKRKYEKIRYKHSQSVEEMTGLRQNFQGSLNKLNSLHTRDVAVRELRLIIDRNVTQDALKIYLSSLGEIKKVKSPQAREQEVLIVGFIAEVFGEKICEEGSKNLIRMLDIVRDFFGDITREVHEAAAVSFCNVYLYCSSNFRDDEVLGVFFDPLWIAMTSGVNVKAQQAASLSIFKWVQVLVDEKNSQILRAVYPRVINLYIKLRTDFPDLISALGVLIESQGLSQIIGEIYPIIKKTIQYLTLTGTGTHLSKIEACKLLSCLAKNLENLTEIAITPYQNEVIFTLQKSKIDKLQSVQNAARKALQDWKSLENIQKEIEDKKMEEISVDDNEIIKYSGVHNKSPGRAGPNNLKTIRDLAKRSKQNSGWGLAKSTKFLEKKTGNYSISPNRSKEFLRKSKEETFYPNLILPKQGVNKDVMEIIQKEHYENKANSEILREPETPKPRREVYIQPVDKRENLNRTTKNIENTFKKMEEIMNYGFGTIEKRLENLDGRMDSTYSKMQRLNNKPSVPSFIHPPKLESKTNFTQTQNNVEIQTAMSQASLPVISNRVLDSLSQAWVEVLQFVNSDKLDEAFEKILETGDDIYLLRLMHKTGVCLDRLNKETSRNVLQRLGMILNSNFLENLGIAWIDEAVREGVFWKMSEDEQDVAIEILNRYASFPGEEGESAENVLRKLRLSR